MSMKILKICVLIWLMFCVSGGLGQNATQEAKKEPLSEWSKQWLEEVVPYIITDAEKSVFLSLPNEEERGRFIQLFWEKKDPDPSTTENEFKIAYYKRIAIANKLFGFSKKDGWRTDRGKIFILLGPPQEIQRDFTPTGSSFAVYHGTRETWNYWGIENPRLPYNLEIVFVDRFGLGDYVLQESLSMGQYGRSAYDINSLHYHFNRLEILAEAMKNPFENQLKLEGIVTTEVTYDLIPVKSDIFRLKGKAQNTYSPIVLKLPYASLSPKIIEDKAYYSLNFLVNVSDQEGEVILQKSKDINFSFSPEELPSIQTGIYSFQTGLFLAQGDYGLQLFILDNFSGKIGRVSQNLSVQNFSEEGLAVSDIILSPEAFKTEKNLPQIKIFIESSDTFQTDGEMHIYFEIYNLTLSQTSGTNRFQVEYLILQNEKELVRVPHTRIEPSQQKDCQVQTSLVIKNFKPGVYVLKIRVTDENAASLVTGQTSFRVVESR
ncbi:MAG: GWxTD domain-containing protein [Candidatus Aminicenantes bacterium]|nr:MAG: GWxTD domain-containing protein [Candidatus Aminicenantes bacterium]